MNKASLVSYVAGKTGLTKKAVTEAVDAMVEAVVTTVKKGDTVTLTGFGTFKVSDRKARNGRNPITGAALKIPAKKVPVFKAGKEFKDMVAKAK
ncbi:MAG TPA: HU family DNA-binding protein [Candidatus Dojkabacteria bacterium]|jgi:DNA-binding protein HU-beta|nr:HU family DNA-binding protein [Candidatus Dojkabacteria bacterium]